MKNVEIVPADAMAQREEEDIAAGSVQRPRRRERQRRLRDSEVSRFWAADDQALFPQGVIAAVLDLSDAYLERGRWAGYGPEFLKVGRLVRYRKKSVLDWLEPPAVASTTEAGERFRPQFGSPRGPRNQRGQAQAPVKRRGRRRRHKGRDPTC